MEIGDRIRAKREALGMSQEELAIKSILDCGSPRPSFSILLMDERDLYPILVASSS